MSVPARALPRGDERPAPSGRPASPPRRDRRPRARDANARAAASRVGFAAVSVAIAGALVVGLVTLNAMVAQSSFRVDDLRARVDDLSRHYALLERQAARLSAPERIAAWAERHGMRLAPEGDLHILKVRGGDGGTATGAAAGEPAIADPGPSLKPIVVGDG